MHVRTQVSLFAGFMLCGSTIVLAQSRVTTVEPRLIGFGTAIALQGNEAFVSRTGETMLLPLNPARPGGVHVFQLTGRSWSERATLEASDASIGNKFGTALSARGDVLAVGAPAVDGGRGAIYLYGRSGEQWSEIARLQPADGAEGDSLGQAVQLLDDLLLAGAPRHAGNGAVYVFARGGSGWSQVQKIVGSGEETGKRFGRAIAVHGTRILVGAPGLGASGAAYDVELVGRRVSERARLVPAGEGFRGFGVAIAMGETHAVIGAPNSLRGVGAAFVYSFDTASKTWLGGTSLPVPTMPSLLAGASVGVVQGDLLVGAPGLSGLQGGVYVFRRSGVAWDIAQTITADGAASGDMFGFAMAVSGTRLAVGAVGMDFYAGKVFAFERDAAGMWGTAGALVDRASGLPAIVNGSVECTAGKAALFDCTDVNLMSFLPVAAIGGARGVMVNDVWGWTDPETRKEYAIVGRLDGTSFIDISNPANPVYLGNLPKTEGSLGSLWRDIKVYRNHAFIVADNAGAHGVQVFDLTQLRSVRNAPTTFRESARYTGIHSAHNIVINEGTGFAYTVGNSGGGETCGGALHMVDIRDPKQPKFAGCFGDPTTGNARTGYTHDAQCVVYRGPDADYRGKEVCFNASETALGIADVTNKTAPVAISSATYPNVAYSHQGWLSEDQRYFFLNDELDELSGNTPKTRTLVFDVADLNDPVLVTQYMGETSATDHNLYIRGNLMYQSNYVSGLRIIDISNAAQPREVGYFDTVPFGDNKPGFAGSWSNYPFFDSGVIVVSSMQEGVFFLKRREALVP